MKRRATGRALLLIVAICSLWHRPALGWIETQVKAHGARVEVSADARLSVSHELILKVRGGPMKTVEIPGIGADIEPLPDATVRSAEQGSAGRWPLHLSTMEDGALRLTIGAERGLRGGNYVFSFGYRVAPEHHKGIEVAGDQAIVTWVGPRLATGVDSARVTFVVPHGSSTPDVAPANEGPGANVLLGEVRRGATQDEVDLVRAHVATGEPAVWRIAVDAGVFRAPARMQPVPVPARMARREVILGGVWQLPWVHTLALAVLALGFAVLLLAKDRAVRLAAKMTDARDVALLPLPTLVRAIWGGASVMGLGWAILVQQLWVVLLSLASALLVSTYLLPTRRSRPRGPGKWQAIHHPPERLPCDLPGAWFDVRSVRGAGCFLLLVAPFLLVSHQTLPHSNYLAVMALLGIVVVLPSFFTGNRRDFPQLPLEQARPWLKYLKRVFAGEAIDVELWGRAAMNVDGQPGDPAEFVPTASWDEVRLRIVLRAAPSGLRAFEVILEERAGRYLSPSVLLRVRDESAAHLGLPKDIPWQRGRSSDERVAILAPTAPSFAQTARLVKSLLRSFQGIQSKSKTSRRSGGSGELMGSNPNVGMAT